MRSRFAWGLCTDIQKPDLETRIAILQKKAMIERVLVPPSVIAEIAQKVDTNVRDLEGAFIRVLANASLMHKTFDNAIQDIKSVNSETGEYSVGNLISSLNNEPSLQQIVKTVAEYFSFEPGLILSNNRAQRIVRPRQISMFLCRALTSNSWAVISRFFGKRDHATVMRAYHKIKEEMEENPQLATMIKKLFPDNF